MHSQVNMLLVHLEDMRYSMYIHRIVVLKTYGSCNEVNN